MELKLSTYSSGHLGIYKWCCSYTKVVIETSNQKMPKIIHTSTKHYTDAHKKCNTKLFFDHMDKC